MLSRFTHINPPCLSQTSECPFYLTLRLGSLLWGGDSTPTSISFSPGVLSPERCCYPCGPVNLHFSGRDHQRHEILISLEVFSSPKSQHPLEPLQSCSMRLRSALFAAVWVTTSLARTPFPHCLQNYSPSWWDRPAYVWSTVEDGAYLKNWRYWRWSIFLMMTHNFFK
jgi:hypothetical protein